MNYKTGMVIDYKGGKALRRFEWIWLSRHRVASASLTGIFLPKVHVNGGGHLIGNIFCVYLYR